MFRKRGLADIEKAQYTKLAVSGATTAVSGLASAKLLAGSVAGPIGLAIAGVGMALTALFARRGPQQKVQTTAIVNEAEPILRDNKDLYLAGPRDALSYQAALDNFDYTWAQVVAACSDLRYGDPGQRCVSDRQRGGQWDWFAYYRDPITDNPPAESSDLIPELPTFGLPKWALPAALVGVGLMFAMD